MKFNELHLSNKIKILTSHIKSGGFEFSALGPVKLERHHKMTEDFGYEILIKREDTIDSFGCGNKLRKLNYIIQDAQRRNANTLITVGSLPSNQCKAVAKVAAENDFRCHLIYGGDKQSKPNMAQGNYLLTTLFNPIITWFEYSSWNTLSDQLAVISEAEKKQGNTPYIIESGGSNGVGILGSIELGIEIALQLKEKNPQKKYDIVCAAGSSGTAVGLQIAAEICDIDFCIHGICIGEPSESLSIKASQLRTESYKLLKEKANRKVNINFYNFGLGHGYDTPTENELHTMQDSIKRYGLIFDLNYMVKTFIGMKELIKKRKIRENSSIILIHTGGHMGIFDNNSDMINWYCDNFKSCIT